MGKKKKFSYFKTQTVWDSGLKVFKKPVILIPEKLLKICRKIDKKLEEDVEFSILTKGTWTEEGFLLSDEYVIPEQEVSTASVDYQESLEKYKQEGFNVVIHKHPSGLRRFSSDDEESINCHFVCSILFCDGEFATAVIKVTPATGVVLQVDAEIQIIEEDDIEVEGLEKIKIRKYRIYDSYYPYRFSKIYY